MDLGKKMVLLQELGHWAEVLVQIVELEQRSMDDSDDLTPIGGTLAKMQETFNRLQAEANRLETAAKRWRAA